MRAYDDPLYLIESIPPEDEDDPIREFLVMGTTGNVYTVTIENEPSCTCPDFQLRQRRCKHIFFILMRVMKDKKYMTTLSYWICLVIFLR